jgi:pimeloyl-ACP methyl ester carboxylesterase
MYRHSRTLIFIFVSLLLLGGPTPVNVFAPLPGYAQTQKNHPVILVHGIAGQASTYWIEQQNQRSIYQVLEADGYNMEFVKILVYPLDSTGLEDTYADISLSADKLKIEIDELLALSGSQTIDIVAHSLGGLITRQYISQYLDDHHINKFIDLATPHSGSGLMNAYNAVVDGLVEITNPMPSDSFIGKYIEATLKENLNELVHEVWMNVVGSSLPDPTRVASQQLDPNGPFIRNLNKDGLSPSTVKYYLLYGDISVSARMNFFGSWVTLNNLANVGDLAMTTKNASTIPNIISSAKISSYTYQTQGFKGNLEARVEFYLNSWKPVVSFDINDPLKIDAWHNGLIRNQRVNETIVEILNDGYTPHITVNATAILSTSSSSSTAMLFDVSGSMSEDDAIGITKIDAAINSGARILDIIQAENTVSQGAEVGILSFSNGAWVNANISPDVVSARFALNSLYPLAGTGMPDGLRLAIDQLSGTQNAKPIIIMLSDGLPNVPLGSSGNFGDADLARQQSLDLASEAGSKGICIYTVGFGIPYTAGNISGEASIDENFLKQVAANSGCGTYYNAQNATQLANVYVNLRHQSTGNVLLSQTGDISQGQTVDIGNVQVPDNQSMILFTLNWPGSQLDAILIDPTGANVDSSYPNASFSMADTLASVIIQNPQPGEWKVTAKGVDVPGGTTTYNAVLSVRPSPIQQTAPQPTIPSTPAFPVVILILVVAGGGIAIYVMTQTRARSRSQMPVDITSAQLVCISGESAGRTIVLTDRLIAGRGSRSTLQLKDQTISRQHAVFRFAGGYWYIQDLNSKTGIFVNGMRVDAIILKNGDHIRIGSNAFEFRSGR